MKIIGGILIFVAAASFYVAVTMPKANNISENIGHFLPPILILAGGVWCWQRGDDKDEPK